MTREEVIKTLSVLQAAYPRFYRDLSNEEAMAAIALWAEMFAGDDAGVVAAAVRAYIAADSRGYPPAIGQIREKVRALTQPQQLTEGEAWALVQRAAQNAGYHAAQEFARLPEAVRETVGSPEVLRQWAMAGGDELSTVVQSNFMRAYRAKAKAAAQYAAIPEEIRQKLQKLGGQPVKRLEGLD